MSKICGQVVDGQVCGSAVRARGLCVRCYNKAYWKDRKGLLGNTPYKLSTSDVANIRRSFASGEATVIELSVKHGVTRQTIYNAIKGKSWRRKIREGTHRAK